MKANNHLTSKTQLAELPLESIQPDPNQARWILPQEIRESFLAGRLTPAEAMTRWRKLVDRLVKKSGKPATELPEGRRLAEIEALAKSILLGGQVNPITVVQVGNHWRIETGERRYWAHVWLWGVEHDKVGQTIPATIQPCFDVYRQAAENLHTAPLNAIATARMVARLLQASGGNPAARQDYAIQLTMVEYRQIAESRVPRGGWKRVEEVMGKHADYLARHLRLLSLPDDAVMLADRHDLTEFQLRPVTERNNRPDQVHIVRLIVELNLVGLDIEWLCQQPDLGIAEQILRNRLSPDDTSSSRPKRDPQDTFYKRIVSLTKIVSIIRETGGNPARALIDGYLKNGSDPEEELPELMEVLNEAMKLIKHQPNH